MTGYGYTNDEVKQSSFGFGLNAGAARLLKFEWTPNGGAGGAEGEAVDIIFKVGDREFSTRKFPITKVFDKQGTEITDASTEEGKKLFEKAYEDFNSWMVALVKCFVPAETVQQALQRPIANFKEYIEVLKALIPANHAEIPLDIFMEYQWNISGDNDRTFLEIPKKTRQGKFICAEVKPTGAWKEVRISNPQDKEKKALRYVDEAGNEHPFTRTGWYMNSNYANMQSDKEEAAPAPAGLVDSGEATTAPGNNVW